MIRVSRGRETLTPLGPLRGLECCAFNQACIEYRSAEWAPVGQVIVIRALAQPDSAPKLTVLLSRFCPAIFPEYLYRMTVPPKGGRVDSAFGLARTRGQGSPNGLSGNLIA